MTLTNFGETLALDAEFSAARYLGLFTTAPTEAGGGVEVAGGSYARVRIDLIMAAAAPGAPSTKANNAAIQFPVATADWATGANRITDWATFDALAAGNMIRTGKMKSADLSIDLPREVLNGDRVTFPIGSFVAKMD